MADSPDQDQHHRVQCPACMGGHSRRVPADLQPKRRREIAVARAAQPAPHAAPAQRPSRRRLQPLTRRGGCSRRRRGHKSSTAARNFRYKISTETVPGNKETCLSIGAALLPLPIEVELQVPREIEPAIGISLSTHPTQVDLQEPGEHAPGQGWADGARLASWSTVRPSRSHACDPWSHPM